MLVLVLFHRAAAAAAKLANEGSGADGVALNEIFQPPYRIIVEFLPGNGSPVFFIAVCVFERGQFTTDLDGLCGAVV